MGSVAIVLFIFAEATTAVIAPGFGGEQRELYAGLFRVMLATPILFAASLTLGEVLLAEQRFAWYGLAPLLYNGGIVAGTLLFSGSLGIFGPAIGAVLGALLHLGQPPDRPAAEPLPDRSRAHVPACRPCASSSVSCCRRWRATRWNR